MIFSSSPRANGISFDGPMISANLENSMVSKSSRSTSGNSFMKDLDKINEQQTVLALKLAKEKKIKFKLEGDIEDYKKKLNDLQIQTGNGQSIKLDAQNIHKELHKLENQMVMSRNKLSCAKSDNSNLLKKINDLRKDKNLLLRVYSDTLEEYKLSTKKLEEVQLSVNDYHEGKHKIQVELGNIKEEMVQGMETFTKELDTMKESIEYNQNSLLEGIRDKLMSTTLSPKRSPAKYYEPSSPTSPDKNKISEKNPDADIEDLLDELNVNSVEELAQLLQQDEEFTFSRYRDVQNQTEEVEKLEMEVKNLEVVLQLQNVKVEELEEHSSSVHKEVEDHIQSIQKQISKHEADVQVNTNFLVSIAESLTNLLKNVAVEEDPMDQHLLSTGINDRNISEFLGIIEERIDYAIQMSKAAARQKIKVTDFKTISIPERKTGKSLIPSLPQLNDTLLDEEEIEQEETSKLRPINIETLKDFMLKKVNKLAAQSETAGNSPQKPHRHHHHHHHHHHNSHHREARDPRLTSDSISNAGSTVSRSPTKRNTSISIASSSSTNSRNPRASSKR